MCAAFCFFVWGAHALSRANFRASPKFFFYQPKKVVGEAPTTGREARALPEKMRCLGNEVAVRADKNLILPVLQFVGLSSG